jgi:hypothetical protein
MHSNLINQISYVPRSQPVRAKVMAMGYGSPALSGGAASTPDQAGSPLASPRMRPSMPKEHPAEIATGLPALVPAREPAGGSIPD